MSGEQEGLRAESRGEMVYVALGPEWGVELPLEAAEKLGVQIRWAVASARRARGGKELVLKSLHPRLAEVLRGARPRDVERFWGLLLDRDRPWEGCSTERRRAVWSWVEEYLNERGELVGALRDWIEEPERAERWERVVEELESVLEAVEVAHGER